MPGMGRLEARGKRAAGRLRALQGGAVLLRYSIGRGLTQGPGSVTPGRGYQGGLRPLRAVIEKGTGLAALHWMRLPGIQ